LTSVAPLMMRLSEARTRDVEAGWVWLGVWFEVCVAARAIEETGTAADATARDGAFTEAADGAGATADGMAGAIDGIDGARAVVFGVSSSQTSMAAII
jgi:hypothetical protein